MRTRVIIALGLSAVLTGIWLGMSLTGTGPDERLQGGPAAPMRMPAASIADAPGPGPGRTEAAAELPDTAGLPAGCTLETRYLPAGDGTTTPAYTCVQDEPQIAAGYASYPTEALRTLAYGDAGAARALAMRLRETDEAEALSLILRAAALAGGDPAPILAYSNVYPHPTSVDGAPVRKAVHAKFVLAAVAELLGAERTGLPLWEAQIRQVSTDPEREIELLMERARRVLGEMQQIELDVTGSSTFGGQSDA